MVIDTHDTSQERWRLDLTFLGIAQWTRSNPYLGTDPFPTQKGRISPLLTNTFFSGNVGNRYLLCRSLGKKIIFSRSWKPMEPGSRDFFI